jgi:hypothetical protein
MKYLLPLILALAACSSPDYDTRGVSQVSGTVTIDPDFGGLPLGASFCLDETQFSFPEQNAFYEAVSVWNEATTGYTSFVVSDKCDVRLERTDLPDPVGGYWDKVHSTILLDDTVSERLVHADLVEVFVHEIGHGLGLAHYDHGTMRVELERDGRMCLDLETLSEFRRLRGGDQFQEVCVE